MIKQASPVFGLLTFGAIMAAAPIVVSLIMNKPAENYRRVAMFDEPTQYLGVGTGQLIDESALPSAFRDAAYFGALVRNGAGENFYRFGYNSLATAEKSAMASCQKEVLIASTCKVVVHLVPLGYAATTHVTLSARGAMALRELQGETGQRAMAVSGDGSLGLAWDHLTSAQAIDRAFHECHKYQRATHPYPGDAAFAPCELIDISR